MSPGPVSHGKLVGDREPGGASAACGAQRGGPGPGSGGAESPRPASGSFRCLSERALLSQVGAIVTSRLFSS